VAGRYRTLSATWPSELPFASALERARALDDAALGWLYRHYLPVVYRFVLGRVGDVHLAEDLTSETFIAMVESIERVRAADDLTFAAWLIGIARNKVAEHYRRQASRPATQGELQPWEEPSAFAESDDPLSVVAARERWGEVVDALRQLTEEQRMVVLYRCVLGYETNEVAQLLNRQPGAIRALQFRALASLARLLALNSTNPTLATVRASVSLSDPSQPARQAKRSDDAPRR
jgi:RNA polymerase sigma-70 factor (ECF subfamily)